MKGEYPKPLNLKFSNIKIGSEYSFSKVISDDDILTFAKLTGDFNQLHIDPQYASSFFKRNIVHGMLAGSFFSTLVGMYCPGKHCLYLSQSIDFVKPIYPNRRVTIKGTVIKKSQALKMLYIKTEAIMDGEIVIRGQAKVQVLEK